MIQDWYCLVEYMEDGKSNMQDLNVLYEDNHIIVVEKPVNIPSQGDKTGDTDMLTIVKSYIKEKYKQVNGKVEKYEKKQTIGKNMMGDNIIDIIPTKKEINVG